MKEVEHATIEKSLSIKEQLFRQACQFLVESKEIDKLSKELRVNLFMFLTTQLIRTPEFRLEIKEMREHLLNILAKERGIDIPNGLRIAITPEYAKRLHLSFMLDPKFVIGLSEMLNSKKWLVLENETSLPLWSSDHPITFFNQYPFDGNLGILSPGVEIHFPLTPNLALTSIDPNFTRLRGGSIKMVEDNVVFHNELQTLSATRFIYSPNDDFMIAKRYLKVNPTYKNPRRRRWTVNNDSNKIEFLRTLKGERITE